MIAKESSKRHDHGYACLAEPVMVSNPLENDYEKSNSLTRSSKSFTHSKRQNSSSNSELVTELVVWLVSGKIYLQKEYHKVLSTLSQMPEEQVLSQITNWPGESGLASAIESKLIPLVTV